MIIRSNTDTDPSLVLAERSVEEVTTPKHLKTVPSSDVLMREIKRPVAVRITPEDRYSDRGHR